MSFVKIGPRILQKGGSSVSNLTTVNITKYSSAVTSLAIKGTSLSPLRKSPALPSGVNLLGESTAMATESVFSQALGPRTLTKWNVEHQLVVLQLANHSTEVQRVLRKTALLRA